MISTNQFKNGMTIELDGDLWTIVEFQHVKPGKGGAFVRTKLKNVKTGAVVDRTFRAGEKFELAHMERRPMQYLYSTGSTYVFMDNTTYEQVELGEERLGDTVRFLKENVEISVLTSNGEILGVELPMFVEMKVTDTVPSVKGDTVSGGTKPATVETGTVVSVPFHINVGDVIRVDTRSGDYVSKSS